MIPKIIHYCWFGKKDLPDSALKCIDSWKRFFPDYEIKEWNESNFDIETERYTSEAYKAGKYAFVSDYVRLWVLYHHGGLYFDTDVEVIKSYDDILEYGSFLGFEINPNSKRPYGAVNPGLGMGTVKGNQLIKEILDYYHTLSFFKEDGTYNIKDAIVNITTRYTIKNGLKKIDGIQKVGDISIYPQDYFNPLDDSTGKLHLTTNTHSIHWFSKTWCDSNKFRTKISRLAHRIFGTTMLSNIKRLLKF